MKTFKIADILEAGVTSDKSIKSGCSEKLREQQFNREMSALADELVNRNLRILWR
jgi:hypothetical protein